MSQAAEQRNKWHFLTNEMRLWDAPFCALITEGITGDPESQALAEHTRKGQPPTQLLAAVQYLLIQGAQHDLRQHFPNLNTGVAAKGDAFALFKDFCAQHRDEIIKLISTRATNTNEIARSAGLNAGFRVIAAETKKPLHLIEIGPSAGFNLLWDRYQIDYKRDGVSHKNEARNPLLTVEVKLKQGGIPPLGAPPTVASRVGLELNPVDLEDLNERDWLRAMIHPDHILRHERIKKLLALKANERPEIRGAVLSTGCRGRHYGGLSDYANVQYGVAEGLGLPHQEFEQPCPTRWRRPPSPLWPRPRAATGRGFWSIGAPIHGRAARSRPAAPQAAWWRFWRLSGRPARALPADGHARASRRARRGIRGLRPPA